MAPITPIHDIKGYLSLEQVERLIAAATNPRDVLLVRIPWRTGIACIYGDASNVHVLDQVNISKAEVLVVTFPDPVAWLARLRKDGIIKPIKPGGFWLYTEEQVRQIPSLIAETRKCEQCGKPRPRGSRRFCRECSQYRKTTRMGV